MMASSPLGGMELALLAMFFGMGLPLGTPPEKENPVMAYAAPADCVLYATWAGMAVPNPASQHQTEQLLAEPQVKEFAAALERAFASAMAGMQHGGPDPERAAKLAKSAPLWARTLLTRPAALFITKLAPEANNLRIEGGLIVQADGAADPLQGVLTELLATPTDKPIETTIAGRKFMKSASKDGRTPELVWGSSNGYLMIGVGKGAIEGLSTRLAARQEPAWLTQLKTNLPVERRSTISQVNMKQLLDTFGPAAGPQAAGVITVLGLKQVTTLQSVTGLDQSGVVSRSLLNFSGPPQGLLALTGGAGITAADLKHIPADAMFATSVSLDPRQTLEILLAGLTEVEPNEGKTANEELDRLAKQTGIDVRAALAALGSRWTLHASAADGGWLGTAATVEVKDRAQLQDIEKKLLTALMPPDRAGARPPGQIFRTPFAGQTITHFAPAGMDVPFLMPSWCLTDQRLIVGINPQAVKSVLLRQPTEKSLADLPEVAAVLSGKDPLLSVSYYDTAQFFESTYTYAQVLLPMATAAMQRQGMLVDFDVSQLPAPRVISRHLRPSVSVLRRTKLGLESESRQTLPGMNVGASAPVAVALLLPAVQSAREAARRMQSSNHLKQIGLGLQNHHDVFNSFPAAYNCDKEGKPLLSWRVAILPFIEQKPLYDEFHHDEPWDSEHNKKLIARMPPTYRSPNSTAGPGLTTYLGVGGKQGVLGAPRDKKNTNWNNGISMAAVIDGTSNTVAVVEAADAAAVVWTKPEEWVPDDKDPFKGLLGMRPSGFLAVFVDGHTQMIPKITAPEMIKRIFMRDDGQQVDIPDDNGPVALPIGPNR